MQEKMAYAGQCDCYGESQELLSKYLLVEVSQSQIQRVTNTYGSLLEKERKTVRGNIQPEQLKQEEIIYAEVDGGMIFTREDGWKEVKAGRIFKASDCLKPGSKGKRGWIRHSKYDAYLGESSRFVERFEQLIAPYSHLKNKLVFISDGALWIKNWINDKFPHATQILDWYHAMEHLGNFAQQYFKNAGEKESWINWQEMLLYNSKVEKVIFNIRTLSAYAHETLEEKSKRKLIEYFESNKQRMDYRRYRSIGAGIIGSGAIESTHRNLVQKRLKLSGQRWSKKGAQNVLALRCANLSGHWSKVINLVSGYALAA